MIAKGSNDTVLDNWGEVDQRVANAQITATGPSGIRFVNVGDIGRREVNAPIITTGSDARGLNPDDETLREAESTPSSPAVTDRSGSRWASP